MNFKISKYALISRPIGAGNENDLMSKRMIFSTRKGMGITVTNYLLSILQAGRFESIPDQLFNILIYNEILVPENEDELDEILKRKKASAQDIKASEIDVRIDINTKWNEDFITDVNSLIIQGLSSPKNRLGKVKLKLDIVAPNSSALTALYNAANDFFKKVAYPGKIKIECMLRCAFSEQDSAFKVEEDFIAISQFHFLVDLRNRSLDQSALRNLIDLLKSLEQNDEKTFFYLIINDSLLDVLQPLRDTLIGFNVLKKVSPKVILVDADDGETLEYIKEQILLRRLSQMSLNLDLLQLPDYKYYSGNGNNTTHTFHPSREFILQWAEESEVNAYSDNYKMEYYDEEIIDQLECRATKCSSCIYLPMCGGRLNKSIDHDKDCPGFISNFMDKAMVKYGIPIQYNAAW